MYDEVIFFLFQSFCKRGVANGRNGNFSFGGQEEFEKHIPELINKCAQKIDITTSLFPEFFNKKTIREPLEKCVEKGSLLRLVLDANVDVSELKSKVSWIFDLANKYQNKVKIVQSKEKIPHVIIIDNGTHFRLESPHPNMAYGEKNLIVFNAPQEVRKKLNFEEVFNNYLENSTEVSTKMQKEK